MSADDPLWDLLRERAERDALAGDVCSSEALMTFRRDSVIRLLDAAVGVLSATRHLVEIAEEVLSEQRDRIRAADAGAERVDTQGDPSSPRRIDLSY